MKPSTSLENTLSHLLQEKGLSVSVAESCTGGLVSSRLTDVSGSSSYIKLNVVTYSNEAKTRMLGVDADIINKEGAVSEKVARQMAQGVRKIANTDIGIGVTGIAGPTGGTPEKPVGLVYIGIADNNHTEVHQVYIAPELKRTEIKYQASERTLELLKAFI